MPALLKSRSRRPNSPLILANRASTDSGLPTSVGTASIRPPCESAEAAVASNWVARRPASATEYPAACSPSAAARPMPLPAPVTSANLPVADMPPSLADCPGPVDLGNERCGEAYEVFGLLRRSGWMWVKGRSSEIHGRWHINDFDSALLDRFGTLAFQSLVSQRRHRVDSRRFVRRQIACDDSHEEQHQTRYCQYPSIRRGNAIQEAV